MIRIARSLVLTLCAVPATFAQTLPQQIDSIVAKYQSKNPDFGISVGLIHLGQEYYTAYGKIARESDVDINKNSVFEIGSVTKAITGNLTAQAALEGKLKLSDYIDGYLPEGYALQPALKGKVTISDLASHQSGLPDLDFAALIALDSEQPVSSVTKGSMLEMVNGAEALTDHGSYRYSAMGFVLLGQILEGVHGMPYHHIVTEKLVAPLQLAGTYTKDLSGAYLTAGYNPEGGVQEFFEWNAVAAAGLVKSSAADMVTYLKNVLDESTPLGQASLKGEETFYSKGSREIGLGLGIVRDGDDVLYMKSGDTMGQSSVLCYSRQKEWGIVILLNRRASKMRDALLNEIYSSVLK